MGFFSWNCTRCGHSVMNPYVVDKETAWKNEVVALFKDGTVLKGSYDGYGRVDGHDIPYDVEVDIQHKRCWEKNKSPIHFEVPSPDAEGQGHFYDDAEVPEDFA